MEAGDIFRGRLGDLIEAERPVRMELSVVILTLVEELVAYTVVFVYYSILLQTGPQSLK